MWPKYLEVLRDSGAYITAADAVDVDPRAAYRVRRDDPEFAELCELALERHREIYIEAARARAIHGVQVPIVGGRNRDEIVAHETKYSDSLMAMFLKRADPSFRDKQEVNVTNNVSIRDQLDYTSLSKRARAKLRELLLIIKEDEALAAQDAKALEADFTEGQTP